MVNWPIKQIIGYISAHEGIRIKITPAYESTRKPWFYMSIKHISNLFSNWLIGQLNELTAIYQPTKDLQLKVHQHLKLHLRAHVIRGGVQPHDLMHTLFFMDEMRFREIS